jgi:hypothetical protein
MSLFPSPFGWLLEENIVGKTMAFFGHSGAQAEQRTEQSPPPQLTGLVTSAFPFLKVKTL